MAVIMYSEVKDSKGDQMFQKKNREVSERDFGELETNTGDSGHSRSREQHG